MRLSVSLHRDCVIFKMHRKFGRDNDQEMSIELAPSNDYGSEPNFIDIWPGSREIRREMKIFFWLHIFLIT